MRSIRVDGMGHLIVINDRHLRAALTEFIELKGGQKAVQLNWHRTIRSSCYHAESAPSLCDGGALLGSVLEAAVDVDHVHARRLQDTGRNSSSVAGRAIDVGRSRL